jgi:hypothetical protein
VYSAKKESGETCFIKVKPAVQGPFKKEYFASVRDKDGKGLIGRKVRLFFNLKAAKAFIENLLENPNHTGCTL